jgi:hypothetical protein
VPLPAWLVGMMREHMAGVSPGEGGLVFPNEVGGALRRTLFPTRIWRPSLVRAGLLGNVTGEGKRFTASWSDKSGAHQMEFGTRAAAIKHVVRNQPGGLRLLSRPGARFWCCHQPVSPDRSPNPPYRSLGNGLSTASVVRRGSWLSAKGPGSCCPGRCNG